MVPSRFSRFGHLSFINQFSAASTAFDRKGSDISENLDFWWSIPLKETSIGRMGARYDQTSRISTYFLNPICTMIQKNILLPLSRAICFISFHYETPCNWKSISKVFISLLYDDYCYIILSAGEVKKQYLHIFYNFLSKYFRICYKT